MEYLAYGERELDHLRRADPLLAEVIRKVGPLRMPMDPDMFTSIVRNIVGQQISIPVYERTWADLQGMFGEAPSPSAVLSAGKDALLGLGVTRRKAEYILGVASEVLEGRLDPEAVASMPDDEAMAALDAVRGIGPWTAEMVLLFHLGRMDVFSYGDLALIRGMRRLYGLDEVPRELFEEYRARFSPYGSIAMLYIWEVGEGRVTLP